MRLNHHQADQTEARIYVAEGVETGLAIQCATGITTWAALGAQNLSYLELPENIRSITIGADPDGVGEAAAQALAQRLTLEGRDVSIAHTGQLGIDFNDVLLRG